MLFRLTVLVVLSFLTNLGFTADPPPPPNYPIATPLPELQNEEQIWVSPIDSNIVLAVWRDFRLGYRQIGLGRSTDGGQTWSDSLLSLTLLNYTRQSDPCIDVDADGNYYICVLDYDGISSSLAFLKSTDDGLSWTQEGSIDGSPLPGVLPSPYFEDKQYITVDRTGGPYQGNIYVSWARFLNDIGGNRIFFSRSTDQAATFPDTIEIGPTVNFPTCGISTNYSGQFAQPLVGADGSVYNFWVGYDTVGCNLRSATLMVKSTDGGASFSTQKRVILHPTISSAVEGGIDTYFASLGATDVSDGPFDGNIYLSWASTDTSNIGVYDWNIYFIRSSNGGDTWSERIIINDDLTGPGAIFDQFHPWLFCNQEGTLVCIFYDQRMDPVNHTLFDLFAAYSFDGGQTWTSNQRISNISSDPFQLMEPIDYDDKVRNAPVASALNPNAGLIGEYTGVTAYKDHVNAIWTDTRNGNSDAYGANWVIPMLDARLVEPHNKDTVITDQPTLTWATAWKNNDDRYRLEVATDSAFSNIVISEVLDTILFEVASPLADLRHYWRVKAFGITSGDSTDYSDTWQFLVDAVACFDPDEDGFGTPSHPENLCAEDNCPDKYNPGQEDSNNDGIGDACCCLNIRGNANSDMADAINIADITFLVNYLFGIPTGPEPTCVTEANANGDLTESVNIGDITFLVNYLFGIPTGPEPSPCP